MSDIAEKILQLLDSSDGSLSSSTLASRIGVDSQKIVGAVKSLQSLGGYIDTEMVSEKKWILSKEGLEVAEKGSHEAVVYSHIPDGGISQKDLMAKCGSLGKIGFSKAMSSGWILIDKADGGLVKRKVDNISDTVQSHLQLVQRGEELDDKTRNDYKKRKLVEKVIEKIYIVKKGANFSTTIKKIPTELTAEMIQSGSWKSTQLKDYNLNSMGVVPEAGCLHPLLKVRAEYRQIFLEMGFTEMPTNNYVESSFWNFDALFQPQQHPARDAHDTFFISDPSTTKHFPKNYLGKVKKIHSSGGFGSQGYGYDWKEEEAAKNLLRTHTTAVSARMLYKLANQEGGFVPQKYFSIDKVFRNETLDATHLAEFHQIEGVIADRGLTLGDLIGVLYQFFTKLGIEKLRFKPAYNPYTEPSMEIFSYHEGLAKWVEIGNSGVFRPEMLLPMGLPEDVNVIAWGLSLERPTMIKYGIDNIRDLVGHKVDLDMVQNNPLCRLDKSNDPVERQVDVAHRRFDKILAKLDILQQRVNIAAGNNNVSLSTTINSSNSSGVIKNIVIHAPASQPPHSLALLLPSLTSSGPCYVSTHIHSSASNSKPSLILNTPTLSRKDCPIKITLIYKDISEVTTILSPTKKLLGEVSLARYLARLASGHLYEDHPDLNNIDEVLDQLSVSLGSKHAATKLLGSVLDQGESEGGRNKRPFLAGNQLSLADLLGLGVAKNHNIATPSVNKWRENCAKAGHKV